MPLFQSCLANIGWNSANIESPWCSESVSGSVIEDTPAETSVNLHGEVSPEEQELDGVRPVVIEKLVAGLIKMTQ